MNVIVNDTYPEMRGRARSIAQSGGLAAALASGRLAERLEVSLAEALVLGLLRQDVSKYLAIFGHGSTELGEVLRVYEEEGVTRTYNFRNEVAMAHAATALRWQYGETSVVVTSIGPGALQAMAGSLAAASNGVGVFHIYGDETTFGEGYNMQQVPKDEQNIFGNITALMGRSYVLHTPQSVRDALRRGSVCVNHPYRAGPFYFLAPINVQPMVTTINVAALPERTSLPAVAPVQEDAFRRAGALIAGAGRVVIKAGGGTRGHDAIIRKLAEAAGAVVVLSPGSSGVMRDDDPRNMHVGGSKGSISGNFAMTGADLLISIGSRSVCQADCSGIGYPNVEKVININGDIANALHYNRTEALIGDISAVTERLVAAIGPSDPDVAAAKRGWEADCLASKQAWQAYKAERFAVANLEDEAWKTGVLTQPVAIKIVSDFAKAMDCAKVFDAGDVQANGFQIVEDDRSGDTFTETGASFMGFAVSALIASGIADKPRYTVAFTGDGSFMMNPQVLIDAVEHGVRGMIVIFDNRRMAAISSLQHAQYGNEFRTSDGVEVDYAAMARSVKGVLAMYCGDDAALHEALRRGHAHHGLTVLHVPVYAGHDPKAGLGAWGDWNVGNWVADVQDRWIRQTL